MFDPEKFLPCPKQFAGSVRDKYHAHNLSLLEKRGGFVDPVMPRELGSKIPLKMAIKKVAQARDPDKFVDFPMAALEEVTFPKPRTGTILWADSPDSVYYEEPIEPFWRHELDERAIPNFAEVYFRLVLDDIALSKEYDVNVVDCWKRATLETLLAGGVLQSEIRKEALQEIESWHFSNDKQFEFRQCGFNKLSAVPVDISEVDIKDTARINGKKVEYYEPRKSEFGFPGYVVAGDYYIERSSLAAILGDDSEAAKVHVAQDMSEMSPYLRAMIEFWRMNRGRFLDHCQTKEPLEEDFETFWNLSNPATNLSANLRKVAITLLRNPEAQKGGNKQIRAKVDTHKSKKTQ